MEPIKIDRTKLKTVKNYALDNRITVQTVYRWIEKGQVDGILIDGVSFVKLA